MKVKCLQIPLHLVTSIRLRIDGLNMYIPALILLETNSVGFSTKLQMRPCSPYTTTPYLEGSSTRVTYSTPNHNHCFRIIKKNAQISFSYYLNNYRLNELLLKSLFHLDKHLMNKYHHNCAQFYTVFMNFIMKLLLIPLLIK